MAYLLWLNEIQAILCMDFIIYNYFSSLDLHKKYYLWLSYNWTVKTERIYCFIFFIYHIIFVSFVTKAFLRNSVITLFFILINFSLLCWIKKSEIANIIQIEKPRVTTEIPYFSNHKKKSCQPYVWTQVYVW